MTKKEILLNVGPGETRVAILEDGRLAEVYYDRVPADSGDENPRSDGGCLGDIILGRVDRVVPGVDAAFVDIGLARCGFLSAREAHQKNDIGAQGAPPIATLVHEGEILVVQVIKDPIGDKGARLSACPTLPGRLLVLTPGQRVVALSRRITDEEDRSRLTAAAEALAASLEAECGTPCGFIVRTAAMAASPDELVRDAERLGAVWRGIVAAQRGVRAPRLLYRDHGPALRALRDHLDADTVRVVIDDAQVFAEARRYAAEALPGFQDRLALHTGPAPLFETAGLEGEIEALLRPRAPLPSGGWITLEATEALTAIDVNSGRLEGACLADTGYRTNLEAAAAIGRQVRLRGIGGLIVVDFIQMTDAAHIEAVLAALRQALAQDRTPVQMTDMSPFGLVEITRKRVREPVGHQLTERCAACEETGRLKSAATVANHALRRVLTEARHRPGRPLRVRVQPEVAAWLTARRANVLQPLEARLGRPLTIEAAAQLDREAVDIEALEAVP